MTLESPDLPEKVVLHFDMDSVGIYPEEFACIQVTGIPTAPPSTVVEAVRTDRGYQIQGTSTASPASIRLRPAGGPAVCSWLRCPRNTAWTWLMMALPGFWLCRHPLRGPLRKSKMHAGVPLDLVSPAKRRMTHRERLGAHSASLQQKAWSVRYHRARFWDFVENAAGSGDATSNLVKASAEFAAHDAAVYSLLDELALALSTVSEIADGQPTPTSFSALPKSTKIDQELGELVAKQGWYEPFHARRTGTAHAFTALVALSETNDIRLFQQTHPKYQAKAPQDLDLETVRRDFRGFVAGLDHFLADFAAYVLRKFHPFDTVTLHLAPNEEEAAEETTVWVHGLEFVGEFEPGREVILDRSSGSIALRHETGSISAVDSTE